MSASAAPFSDSFVGAGALDIAGTRGVASADLDLKTREAGEPTVPGSDTDHTVWWRYVPTADGFAKFSTCRPTGTNPLPQSSLGVYTGSQVNLLASVAQGTNNCPAGFENAQVGPFAVTAGTYYYVQIGGATSLAAGETDLSLTLDFNPALPTNDNWASAMDITGALPQSIAANNGLATSEAGEPGTDAYFSRQSLWYTWTATFTGAVSVNNCGSVVESNADSIITAYTGTAPVDAASMSYLDEADGNCPGGGSNLSRLYLPVTSGTKYWFKLSNYSINYGFPYLLQLKQVTTPEIGRVPELSGFKFRPGLSAGLNADGYWGGYPTPTVTRQWVRCDAAGANCTNIAGATGFTYAVQAADVGSTLRLRETASNSNGSASADSLPTEVIDNTPPNDNWANFTDLGSGSTISINDDNNWATHAEAGEPAIGANPAKNSVWYRWTPAVGGNYAINNCLGGLTSLDFLDLMIGIRSGTSSLATTNAEGAGDDGCGPNHPYRTSMLFLATAGTTYSIEVASKYAAQTGPYTLSITPVGDPVVTVQPSISGTAAPGGTLVLDMGDWISPTSISPVIHWYVCDSGGNNCVDTGLAGTNFSVLPSHSGKKLKATITLANPYGTVTPEAFSPVIAADSDGDGILDVSDTCPSEAGTKPNGCLPSDIVGGDIPAISGNLVTGQTLTASTGTWSVLHDPLGYTLSYQWQRCNDGTPGSCSDISGATGNTYLIVAGDLTKTIRVAVTATNTDDSAVLYSLNSAAVTSPPPAPSNTGLPTVSGSLVVGQSVSTSNGTWTPGSGVGFTYEWLRCTDNVSALSCTTIPAQTAASYTLVAGDLGTYIRSKVTGTNVTGAASATSNASAIVIGDSDGDGVPDNTDDCPSEAGPRANGCLPSDIVANGVPAISGTAQVGFNVTSSQGSWTVLHDPLTFTVSHQWQRCDDATIASCSDIPGANSNLYSIVAADYGKRVRVIATATNADDTESQASDITSVISQVPGATVNPAVTGNTRVGQVLTTTDGTWVPADATLVRSWYRCTDAVSFGTCTTIPSETGTTYTLVAADDNKYIRSGVTGTSTAGSTFANSTATAKIITDGDADGVPDATDACPAEAGNKPNGCLASDIVGAGVPTISGTLEVGFTLTSTTGSWTVLHDQLGYTLSYQWQRCDTTSPATCADIASATGSTYVQAQADYGKRIRVNVTATNADDTALQSSAISNAVSQVPGNSVPPTLSGNAQVGSTLTSSTGTWIPNDGTYTYAWRRCDTIDFSGCVTIAGQTASTYTLVAADATKYVSSSVTSTTTAGSGTVSSAPAGPIASDTDGDGVIDTSDTCPTEFGARPNGCPPSDIVAGTAPDISGTFVVGSGVTSTTGTWTVLHDPLGYTVSYQWQRCDDATPASCSNIAGATTNAYTFVVADYGKRVRVVATATNADDSASQPSAISAVVSQNPANTGLPTVSGTATRNLTLTAGQGTWTPADATLSNVWLRCTTTAVGSCSPIAGQTGSTYVLAAADVGNYIRVQVTATTTAGTAVATSSGTAQVAQDSDGDGVADSSDVCPAENGTKPNGCLPSDIVGAGVPTVSGTLSVGQSLSGTTGTWTVLHDPLGYTVSYQWQRCNDATAASCSNIGSATGSSYVLAAADYGKRVRLNVTAANADDSALQSSAISGVVSQVPTNSVAPSITGVAGIGQTLTAAQGTWSPGDATLANAWLRCNDNVSTASCSPIAGQTGATYLLAAADDSKYIRLQVTATTTAGTLVVTSAPTAQVVSDSDGDGVPDASDTCPSEVGAKPNGCPPSDIVGAGVPTVSGTLNVGQVVSSTTGSWTVLHDPLGYTVSYQWQRCNDATTASCSNIATATASTYTLVAADYGKRVRVNVTATNADDSALQSSAISAQISQVPNNSVLPSITGTTRVGQALTGSQGTWTPGDATLTNAWLRCTNTTLGSCTPIASQTGGTYTLVAADNANYIRLQVTATAGANTTVATSAATSVVFTDTDNDGVVDASDTCPTEAGAKPNGCPPSDIVGAGVPTVSGTLNVGQVVSSTTGSWTVLHDPLGYTVSYQWQRCNDATTASCSNIATATASTYTLVAADYGKRVRVNVTATNADDSALQSSAISAQISQTPVNNTLPSVSGTAKVGQSLSAGQGAWTPVDAALTNVWLRCTTTSVGSCSTISGETGSTYTLVAADDGKYIRLQVTATTAAGTAVATSNQSAQVFTDSDNDGVINGSDACPAEAGTKPNGCLPSDIQANGVPTLSGNLTVGDTISSTGGSWLVLHDQLGYTLGYQWERCDTTSPASCATISGATGSNYVLTATDVGKHVRSVVTATNADDSAAQPSAISAAVQAAGAAPVNNTPPTVGGTTEVGQTLTAVGDSNDWTPNSSTLSYEWNRCTDNVSEATCETIASATASSFVLTSAEADKYIRVRVTAAANAQTSFIVSAASAKVTTPPASSGGGGGSATPPPAAPGPNLGSITGPANLKTLQPSARGGLTFNRVSVYCGSKSTGNCTGSAVLTAKIGGKKRVIGALKLSTLRGGGRTIGMKISGAAMKALRTKSLKAELTVTYTAPGYTPVTYLGRVTLKKPKQK
ncbi:MAG: thrombospondin type 3 repeat-containing protein [Thermoleophilaceae bacterium]|nr:thrombospondin type 3 repeat-containing protein [Thermoleophilaceae bacterium]